MKASKLAFILIVLFNFFSIFSQELEWIKQDTIVKNSWMIGLGFNAVDDADSEFFNFFAIQDNWNIVPYPSRLSVGRYFKNGLGLEAIGTYNQYKIGKIIDGIINTEEIDYYAVDIRASYDLNKILGSTGFFDPYIGLGIGYADANNQSRGTYNATIGFRTWLTDRFGLDFNSKGKWPINNANATSHMQHAAGIVYELGAKNRISLKDKKRYSQLLELQQKKQREQDSLVIARLNEKKAKEYLKNDMIAKKRLAEVASKEEANKARKTNIAEEINNIGMVYFELNSSYLTKIDKELLDKLIILLNKHLDLVIHVASHSDARGTEKYNQWLSERRVKRITEYLILKGIAVDRLQGKAFGETQLINICNTNSVKCSEEEHKINRRSNFTILSY